MSDHFSGPAVMGDPSVDITDFYAFPSPERPGNLVLIMDVFPLATSQSFFSDVVTHRFRLRPLTRSGGSVAPGTAEHTIDVTFNDVPEGTRCRRAASSHRTGARRASSSATPLEQDGMRVFAGLVERPVLHGRRGRAPHGYVGQAVLRHGREHRPVSRRPVDRRRGSVCADRRTLRWRHARWRHRGEPRHAPRQADPDRTSRTAGDQELRPGQPDARSAHEGRRASRPLQPRRRLCALPGISTALRVASRCEPGLLRWSRRQDGVAARSRRAPSVARSAHRRFPDPRSRARIRAGRLPRDRTRADRQPPARERRRSLARRRHPRRAAHADGEWRARRAVRRRRRRSHQAGQPDRFLTCASPTIEPTCRYRHF